MHASLRCLADRESIDSVTEFAEEARRALRQVRPLDTDAWTPVYERGLVAALAQNDLSGLAAIVGVGVNRLDAEGRLEDAVALVDYGLVLAATHTDARVVLHALKAPYLVGIGDVRGARDELARAAALRPRAAAFAAAYYDSVDAAMRCLLLEPDVVEEVGATMHRLRSRMPAQGLFVLSWLIPYIFAAGEGRAAEPWVRDLRLEAERGHFKWRQDDAALFDFALRARDGSAVTPPSFDLALEPFNWHAAWRACTLELRRESLSSNLDAVRALLDRLASLRQRAHPAVRDGIDSFAAFASVGTDPVRAVDLPLPPPPSLLNLPAALAGAEALAIAGEVESAVAWLRWLAALPPSIQTSLEWPVARWRVQGLLEVRLGDTRRGIASLRKAIQWSTHAGYDLEAALAQLQLAEVMELGGRNPRMESRKLRQRARSTLDALEVDFTAQAYAATRVVALGRAAQGAPRLSSRELEVLTLFAKGMDYRDAADVLGISWRTVQTHAVHAYAKIGAPNRAAALVRARDLSLL